MILDAPFVVYASVDHLLSLFAFDITREGSTEPTKIQNQDVLRQAKSSVLPVNTHVAVITSIDGLDLHPVFSTHKALILSRSVIILYTASSAIR